MKLTKDQKQELKAIMSTWGKDIGVKFITHEGVVTLAWARIFPGSKMIAVSASYYDEDETDRFRKSTGKYFAIKRLSEEDQQCIQVPLGHLDDEHVREALTQMFYL